MAGCKYCDGWVVIANILKSTNIAQTPTFKKIYLSILFMGELHRLVICQRVQTNLSLENDPIFMEHLEENS